uniref:Putative salivary kunitz domain protein n=1 Tax=Ixodes ricinus TaxID=34613 RepID=A0A0K8RBX7_IXORI
MKPTMWLIFVTSLVIMAFIVENTASKNRRRPRMPPRCLGEPDVSSCRALLVVYFYNKTTRRCQRYPELGCPRDGNGFLDEDECLEKCQDNRRRVRPKNKGVLRSTKRSRLNRRSR